MWKDADCASIGHFLRRALRFAQQVQKVENVRPTSNNTINENSSGKKRNYSKISQENENEQNEEQKANEAKYFKFNIRPWNKICLHPECDVKHRNEDCPIAFE